MVKLQVNEIGVTANIEYPITKNGPGIVVLHAWWGLNDFIVQFCKSLAKEGFFVVAPDSYNGKVANTIKEAEELVDKVDRAITNPALLKTVDFILNQKNCTTKKISVIGFSLGASWAGWLANNKPNEIEKVVLFYGTGDSNFTNAKASFLCHFAENDPYEDAPYIKIFLESIRKAGLNISDYIYPQTHHWFFESDKKEYYKEEQSKLAWKRTVEFLKSK